MNSKKFVVGLVAVLIALIVIVFSVPRIKHPRSSNPAENKPLETLNAPAGSTNPAVSDHGQAKPAEPTTHAPTGVQSEPPAVLPMPGAPPPVPPKKK